MSLTEENRLLVNIAAQFVGEGEVESVAPLGNGNINSTFLVTVTLANAEMPAQRFVLQRINTKVFRQPELVIQNMVVLGEHLRASVGTAAIASTALPPRRWETPQILPTQQGQNYWIDAAGEYWRAISFIEDSHVCETVRDAAHAEEVGYGLAMFHRLISELPADKLADTLPGFHITPTYLADYERVLNTYSKTCQPAANRRVSRRSLLFDFCRKPQGLGARTGEGQGRGSFAATAYSWRSQGEQHHDGP